MRKDQQGKWRTIQVWHSQYRRLKILAAQREHTLVETMEWMLAMAEGVAALDEQRRNAAAAASVAHGPIAQR